MMSLLVLFQALTLAKFANVFIALGSIVLSLWAYGMLYGWSFGAGIIALILVHELGHYYAAHQKHLNPSLPNFMPFVGAWVSVKDGFPDAETEAYVAYAGPFVGALFAFGLYYWGRSNDSGYALALAQAGFVLNLFNLIPLHPLDGGRITAVISPKLWLLGAPILLALWFYQPSPLLILITILAVPQVIKALQDHPDHAGHKTVSDTVKFEYGVLYLALTAVLALMVHGT